MKYILNTYKFT